MLLRLKGSTTTSQGGVGVGSTAVCGNNILPIPPLPHVVQSLTFRASPLSVKSVPLPLGLCYPMTVKVEVNLYEQRTPFPFMDVRLVLLGEDRELTNCSAQSYDIQEMQGTKLRARLQSKQGRDLFDLHRTATFEPRAMPARTIGGGRVIDAFNGTLRMKVRK